MHELDSFITEPGKIEEMTCEICGTKCKVTRNIMGATSWAEAMAKRKHAHDYFECPHREEQWHKTAVALIQAIKETPSKRIAELMRLDLVDILRENGHDLME